MLVKVTAVAFVGGVAHEPPNAPNALAGMDDIFVLNMTFTLVGVIVKLVTVGRVLATVMRALSGETVERFPRLSCAVPASTWTVKVPTPRQLLREMSAPAEEMLPTETVQEGFPLCVVTVTPPPAAVSVPLNFVPPAADAL